MPAQVRYFVTDVEETADFYTTYLGFKQERKTPALAVLSHGDLQLWLVGPNAAMAKPILDGSKPEPGGWNRIVVTVQGLDPFLAKLKDRRVVIRDDVSLSANGRHVLFEDPSGNLVEIFEPG